MPSSKLYNKDGDAKAAAKAAGEVDNAAPDEVPPAA